MSRLFLKNSADTIQKSAETTDGEVIFNNVLENDTYTLRIKDGLKYDALQNIDEFIITKNGAASVLETDQNVLVPTGSNQGSIEVEWNKYINYAYLERWNHVKGIIAANKAAPINYDTFTKIGPQETGARSYSDGVLTRDGLVILIPRDATHFVKYDIAAKTLTDFSQNLQSALNRYLGGVLLPDDTILLYPGYYGKMAIFDYKNDVLTQLDTTYLVGVNDNFRCGNLTPDGRVVLPQGEGLDQVAIFDPISREVELIGKEDTKYGALYNGAVLLENGKIIAVPGVSDQPALIDPIAKTVIKFGVALPTQFPNMSYGNGILLEDGRVMFVPKNAAQAAIVDPTDYTIRSFGPSDAAVNKFGKGALLLDGRVIFPPAASGDIAIANPYDETITYFATGETGDNKYSAAVPLPTGEVLLINETIRTLGVLSASDGLYGTLPDPDLYVSAYISR